MGKEAIKMVDYNKDVPALISAQEISDILGIKLCSAYKIIRNANEELAAAGKITIRGKLNRKYFYKMLDVSNVN